MTVLVDPAVWPWRGRHWAHLVSDESFEELHLMADQLGIERRWFQGDHYDVPAELRERAIELGAVPVPSRELVRRLIDAGLRRRRSRDAPDDLGGELLDPLAPLVGPAAHEVAQPEEWHEPYASRRRCWG